MFVELILKFTFEASHSLSFALEKPHPHLWRLELSITGTPIEGRVIDIVPLRAQVQELVDLLSLTFLNENPHLNESARLFPTCETLSEFFRNKLLNLLETGFLSENPSVRLHSVLIAICNMNGEEMGAVRLTEEIVLGPKA